jgi:hypothetical protein
MLKIARAFKKKGKIVFWLHRFRDMTKKDYAFVNIDFAQILFSSK